MSYYDVYEFLKQNPDKAYTNNQLAEIMQISIATINQNTKKLRDDKLINYDLELLCASGRKVRLYFFLNKNRQPMVYFNGVATPRVSDFTTVAPYNVRRQRIATRSFNKCGESKTIVPTQDMNDYEERYTTGQLWSV